jgi:broad specificity phosphatase PhoE
LPDDFTKKSFDDKNFKVFKGESLNEMDKRFNDFIEELLKTIVLLFLCINIY